MNEALAHLHMCAAVTAFESGFCGGEKNTKLCRRRRWRAFIRMGVTLPFSSCMEPKRAYHPPLYNLAARSGVERDSFFTPSSSPHNSGIQTVNHFIAVAWADRISGDGAPPSHFISGYEASNVLPTRQSSAKFTAANGRSKKGVTRHLCRALSGEVIRLVLRVSIKFGRVYTSRF